MKKIVFVLSLMISIFLAINVQAQTDTNSNINISELQNQLNNESLNFDMNMNDLEKNIELQTEVQAQKLMKNIFLSAFIFMSIIVLFLLYFYHAKIKKIFQAIEKQEEEIIRKNFHIDKLNLLLQKTFDAVAIADKQGNILWGNLNFYNLRGLNTEDKVNLFEETPEAKEIFEKINENPQEFEYKVRLPQKNIIIVRKIFPLIKIKDEKVENYGIVEKIYQNT